jgi:anthranilate phosphoribosyltransferase
MFDAAKPPAPIAPMALAPYLKLISRGPGSRGLDAEQAADLMAQVLDGRASDLEVGAFALAMRMKGETLDELCGFVEAVRPHCLALPGGAPAVLLPSYNGSRRLPNLTPLLALRLASAGVNVLVHGVRHDPDRVTSAEILAALGLAAVEAADEVTQAWARGRPAFLPIDVLCPPLARLLEVRHVLGLRNSGHTLAKLLDPFGPAPALRVVNHTHPEFGALIAGFAQRTRADIALLRGTEGEPVADARRQPRLEILLHGERCAELSLAAHDGPLVALPSLPQPSTAATARYVEAVLAGTASMPEPIEQQAQALAAAVRRLAAQSAH